MHELSKILSKKGHHVEIFTYGDTTKVYHENGAKINRFSVIDLPLIRVLHLSRRISKHLENNHFDVYHVNTAPLAFFLEKKSLVVTAHTTLFGEGKGIGIPVGRSVFDKITSFYYKKVRFLDKKAYNKAKTIIAVNDNIKDELERVYKINKEKITTIYNGVNTEIFYAMKNRHKIKEELGLDSQTFVVLYVGRLVARKNVGLLIEAMHHLRRENIVTLIVGKGPKEAALKRMIKHLGLGTSVKFVGYVKDSDLVRIYNAADVLVLPSVYEGMPLNVLEAMACGVPTIAANFQGVENIIQHGENGIILEKTSVECLAKKIAHLHRKPEVCRNMSAKAIQIIKERFSWQKTVEETINVYQCL